MDAPWQPPACLFGWQRSHDATTAWPATRCRSRTEGSRDDRAGSAYMRRHECRSGHGRRRPSRISPNACISPSGRRRSSAGAEAILGDTADSGTIGATVSSPFRSPTRRLMRGQSTRPPPPRRGRSTHLVCLHVRKRPSRRIAFLEPFQGGSYSQGIERYRIARMSSSAGDDPTAVAWSLPALLRSFDLAGARTRLRTSDLACEEVRDPCP